MYHLKIRFKQQIKKEALYFLHVVMLHTVCIQSDGGSVCFFQKLQGLLNSEQHHKVFYRPHCVTNTLSSAAALTTLKVTEGGLVKFNNLNAFGTIFKTIISVNRAHSLNDTLTARFAVSR